jgi:predicted HicB family RNase H-like nuclease
MNKTKTIRVDEKDHQALRLMAFKRSITIKKLIKELLYVKKTT